MPKKMSTVSIVTPVFNEEKGLDTFVHEVTKSLFSDPRFDIELILVDDGSEDGSWSKIEALCVSDPRFRGLRLSRNFGSHTAINAGLHAAKGDAAGILACDLQDPVSALREMIEIWLAGRTDVIWGARRSRPEGLLRRLLSELLNRILKRSFHAKSLFCSGSFLFMDRKVIAAYRSFNERQRNTFAIIAWTGFREARVYYDRKVRGHGSSGWSMMRLLTATLDTILSYSNLPITLISALGVTLFLLSTGLGVYILASYVLGRPASGWTSITLLITGFFGLQFLILGVLGEYLRRIYLESLRRPHFLIAEDTARD